MLALAIPSRNEVFLRQTVEDVLKNARGDIEVYPVLDGYSKPLPESERVKDPRVHYLEIPLGGGETHKRHAINMVADLATEFVASADGHCMFAPGFDVQLTKDHKDKQIQIPRRHRLDAENWCLQTQVDKRPPIDYEYTMYPLKFDRPALHGFKWDARTLERWDIPIDETMHFQGSFWFMHKDYFKHLGLMQVEGYTGWGQEAEEIRLKAFRDGGTVVSNKNTWYAHLHKGPKHGRMYYMSKKSQRDCNAYAYDYWVYQNKDTFIKYIERFWPLPGWPEDWKEQLWKSKNQ